MTANIRFIYLSGNYELPIIINNTQSFNLTNYSVKIEINDTDILNHIQGENDIRFYEVCPICNKRVKLSGEKFNCPEHGDIEPAYSYVMNIIIDDGSGNIRTAFFSRQVQKLLQKEDQEILKYKDNPTEFEKVKSIFLYLNYEVYKKIHKK